MKNKITLLLIGSLLGLTACNVSVEVTPPDQQTQVAEDTQEEKSPDSFTEDTVISTDLFTLTVPDEFKGKFLAQAVGNEIFIYDKECYNDGFGGFVFSVIVDKDDEVLAGGMYTKVGEYDTSDGQVYDVCKSYASEVQWDYNKYDEMPEDFAKLYNATDDIIASAKANGDGDFKYGVGIKGEDLYGAVIAKYAGALSEGWDANRFEEEGMSPEFYALTQADGDKAYDKMGFAYKDITNDGVDDLLVGVIGDDEQSVVYDVYTMVEKSPASVVSGTARNSYRAMEYGGIANVFSGGAGENGVRVYIIDPGTGELVYQYGIKYDSYTDEKAPWYVNDTSSDDDDKWVKASEEDYNTWLERASEQFVKLDFTPFSEVMPVDLSKVDLSKYATFTKMLDDFKKGMGYANEKIGDTDVFLVSSGTYNGENGTHNAMDASVFIYGEDKILYLGTVRSSGTAYPVTIADGCLFTGGHHNVVKSTVKDGKLITVDEASEVFDTDGNATYYHGSKKVKDDTDLSRLFDEYFAGEAVDFSVEKK